MRPGGRIVVRSKGGGNDAPDLGAQTLSVRFLSNP